MKILVTGGAGRLGRSVVELLASLGHDVHSADRQTVPDRDVPHHVIDLTDPAATTALLASVAPEAVVHLAAIAVPFSAPEHDILLTNTALTMSVVEASIAAGVTRILISSSPTVIGYNSPTGWTPTALPLDEHEPALPWNAYALSKLVMEAIAASQVRQHGDSVRFGVFRPCYVVSAEEWAGAPTQQGHTVVERLQDPALAAVSLFNYVDARDAAAFVAAWLAADDLANGEVFFVGAPDAMAVRPVAELWSEYCPALGEAADELLGQAPVFSAAKAERLLDWRATRTWRRMLPADALATLDPATAARPPQTPHPLSEGAPVAVR